MNETLKKIKEAIAGTGLKQQEFCKKYGIGETMVSQWIAKDKVPSINSLEKIAKATGKPLSFFLEAAEEHNKANRAKAYAEAIKQLGYKGKIDPNKMPELEPDGSIPDFIPVGANTMTKLPVLANVQCGSPEYSLIDEKNIEDYIPVPVALFPDADFIVKCNGDSMIPEIMPDAFCIVKKIDVPLNNKNMLIKTEKGFTIKKVKITDGKPSFWYLNPKGKELKAKNITVIGKIVGSYMKY